MKKINKIIYSFLLVGLAAVTSCTNADLDPTLGQGKELEGNITSDEDLYGIIKGAYNRMTASAYYGRDYIINGEVRSDNTFANGNSGRFSTQAAFLYNRNSSMGVWTDAYRVISSANLIINADAAELKGDADYIAHLQGQAYVLRALAHFDLMKEYGQQHVGGDLGVPYVTEFKGNEESPARLTVNEVKAKIYEDLNAGFNLMDASYDNPSKEFVTKFAAKAIESKVATYFGDWNTALAASKAVIDSGLYGVTAKDDYVTSWTQKGTKSSIFELAFSQTDNVGINGLGYIYRGPNYGDIEVLPNVPAIFEAGDVRADILGIETIGEKDHLRNMGKFPELQGWDNVIVTRYEEVLLNYAEALFETGGDALAVLNQITAERGASAITAVTKDVILLERRKELMFEGYRFYDLVRTGNEIPKVDSQQSHTGIPAGDYRMAFPIPVSEMDVNSKMEQNGGY